MSKKSESKTDEELMEAYQMGEAAAFEILFHRHSGRVFGFLAKRVVSQREAHDLSQEAFLKLHRSKHLYKLHLPFGPWLFSITRSVWLDHLRKRRLEDPTDVRDIEKISAVPVQALSPLPAGMAGELLNVLPPSQRDAVSLRVCDEATFEEIALRLSTTPENARQLVSRGLKRLRKVWGSEKG